MLMQLTMCIIVIVNSLILSENSTLIIFSKFTASAQVNSNSINMNLLNSGQDAIHLN